MSGSPIPTLVVDDEPLARELIISLIRRDADLRLVGECGDGAAALDAVARHRPALVFMDVQMPVMDGVELAQRMLAADPKPFVIFVTAYDAYAIEAFEMQALDYLVKPLSKSRFHAALARAKEAIRSREIVGLADRLAALGRRDGDAVEREHYDRERYDHELTVRAGDDVVQLLTSEVDWIEAANQYVHIHAGDRRFTVSESLGQYAKRIRDPRFFRVHRSALVNGAAVMRVSRRRNGTHRVVLRTGEEVCVARSRAALVPNMLRAARLEQANE